MNNVVKIVLPVAGLGMRLRPHTLYRPKPLVSLAGRTILDFVLEQFTQIKSFAKVEFAFIIGDKGEMIKDYMAERYPDVSASYFVQKQMLGQSDAVYNAKEFISGPTLVAFGDTITDPDLSILANNPAQDNFLWVKESADVSQLGVVKVRPDGTIERLHEKPKTFISNLALVGFYYFPDGATLLRGIEEQYRRGSQLNNEYYLADAINILIEQGVNFRPQPVNLWLDAGKIDTLLETNTYLLQHGHDNSAEAAARYPTARIIPPVLVQENVHIQDSVIGPNVVVEAGCSLDHAVVSNAIIQQGSRLKNLVLDQAITGRGQQLQGEKIVVKDPNQA